MNRNTIRKAMVLAAGAIFVSIVVVGLLAYFTPLIGFPSTLGEHTAELSCRATSNPMGQVTEFSDLTPDKQQKVKSAVEDKDFVKINSSQEDFFEEHPNIRFQNKTYICEVGEA